MKLTWSFGLVVVVTLAVAACSAPPRDPVRVKAIREGRAAFDAEQERVRRALQPIVLERAAAIARGETRDDTLDVLALSGGADWGAFGAGYLARWSEQGDAAPIPMPEFDIIGGISTGSLIGTYIAAGTPQRYAGIEDFYRRTSPDWVTFPGIGRLLPSSIAIFDNGGVRKEVARAVDDQLIADLARAHAENRVVVAATTNLDFGVLQYWNLGQEATAGPAAQSRIVDILMAATAIPGAFPPVEIDGNLHADGGAVQGVPAIDPARLPRFKARWDEVHPDLKLPLLRYWFIFNNQIGLQPDPVGLSWFDVVFRSYQTISQTSFKAPVQASLLAAQAAEAAGAPPLEVRWIAVPDDFVPDPTLRPFDPRTTNALADLGRAAADAPGGGWRSDFPD